MTAIPTLETGRLRLRAYRADDFDSHAALWADPAVTRFIGAHPITREQAWTRFLRYAGSWQMLGFGFWAVEEKTTGHFLGEAGFHDMKRELTPSLDGTLETGWAFMPEAQGKGIATETVGAVLAWGGAAYPGRRVTCIINPDNAASRRVAEKSGFREFGRTTYHGAPVVLFER